MIRKLNLCLIFSALLITISCVYDPPNSGPAYFYNCSDKAIYVYYSKSGKLEIEPRLELFEPKKEEFMFENIGCGKLLQPPMYRVNAYEQKEMSNEYLEEWGYYDDDSIIFFFIAEQVMKDSTWEDIVDKQLFEKRISLTIEQYHDLFKVVTYTPND